VGLRPVQSPNGQLIASIDKYNVCVRDAESLDVVARFVCLDAITQLLWSPDSEYILCAQNRRKIVQVWSITDPEWTCKIDETIAGLTAAMWSPDSRHILTVTDFQLRISIWSLINRAVYYIKYPKFSNKGIVFSPDGKFLAVLERDQGKDFVGLYHLETWQQVNVFAVETEDAVDLQWSADSRVLVVTDNCTTYGVLAYSLDGRQLVNYKAYSGALGVKSTALSPQDTFIAVGSYDDKLRLINSITWQPTAVLPHPATITLPPVVRAGDASEDGETKANRSIFDRTIVYKEVPTSTAAAALDPTSSATRAAAASLAGSLSADVLGDLGRGGDKATKPGGGKQDTHPQQTLFEIDVLPVTLRQQAVDPNSADPATGVCSIEWSKFGEHYVATRSDSTPCAVWIWDVPSLKLHSLLITMNPVRCMRWDPCSYRLAVCCGNDKLYLWSPEAASVVSLPVVPPIPPAMATGTNPPSALSLSFSVRNITWLKDGNAMILCDRDSYTVCYFRE